MTRNRQALWALVWSGAILFGVDAAQAKQPQSVGSKPGIGVSGIGVSAVFVPAPGVATPTVTTKNITTPMAIGNPGVTSRNTTTQQITGAPGVAVPGVQTKMNTAAPGVATRAAAVDSLPKGYYTAIPSTDDQRMYKGIMCYYVNGIYYRPEYYMGSLVYVIVP